MREDNISQHDPFFYTAEQFPRALSEPMARGWMCEKMINDLRSGRKLFAGVRPRISILETINISITRHVDDAHLLESASDLHLYLQANVTVDHDWWTGSFFPSLI